MAMRLFSSTLSSVMKTIIRGAHYLKVMEMKNGMKIVTEENCSPLASIALFVDAGPRFETMCNNGITYFIGHMALKGFQDMNRADFEKHLLQKGIKISVETRRDYQAFIAHCFPKDARDVVDILANIVTSLELSDHEIAQARKKVWYKASEVDKNPKAVLFDYLHKTAFQGTPLMLSVMGLSANLQMFDKNYLQYFMCHTYLPHRMALVSSGNLSQEDMLNNAGCKFDKIPKASCPFIEYGPCRFTGSQVLYRNDSLPYAHVAIAVEAPGLSSSDYLLLHVAKCIVGSWQKRQGGGLNNASVLARAASVSDICDSYESFYIAYRDVGLWGVYFVSQPMELEDMLYNVQSVWMELCTMITKSDVERGVNRAILELSHSYEGSLRSCRDAGRQILRAGHRRGLNELCDEIRNFSLSAVRTICDSILYNKCPAIAALGPTEGLPDYNRTRAGMYWLRR